MKKFKVCLGVLIVFLLICSPVLAMEDDVSGGTKKSSSSSADSLTSNYDDKAYEKYESTGVSDLLGNYNPVSSDNIASAQTTLSPLTNFVGVVIGGILVLTSLGIFLITALDLFYISFPPIRSVLCSQPTGGMGGGMGMRGGMGMGMGGMGMGGMQGGMQKKPRQWVSDEALQCAALMGGGQQGGMGGGMGMRGGMGMGYGGGMMGGMGGMQQQQQGLTTGSAIGAYFKKRVVFLILFVISSVLLTSSLFMGVGINMAKWLTNVIVLISNSIPGI